MNTLERLAAAVDHPAPARREVPRWQLLLALGLAPAAFTVQVVLSYAVASNLCGTGATPHPALLAINLLALAVAASGLALSLRLWRRLRGEKRGQVPEGRGGDVRATADQGEGRTRFLALCAVCASTLLGLAVVFDAGAVLVLGACPGFAPVG